MTIRTRLRLLYGAITLLSLGVAAKLGYHEFIAEPREFARMGLSGIHKDTTAEMASVVLLCAIPVFLGLGWIWINRALSPLSLLVEMVEALDEGNWDRRLPLTGRKDEVERLSVVFNAMSSRLSAKIRRIKAEKASVSHELKTPIAIMRLQFEEMLRGEKGRLFDRESGGLISSQMEELARLSDMIDVLTMISIDDMGGSVPNMEDLDLAELVTEISKDARLLAEPQDIRVAAHLEIPVRTRGNRQRLRQLLLVLVENALRHNRPSGSVSIALIRDAEGWELAVTNTSKGALPEDTDRLFDPFVRGEHDSAGSGLGLAIARWIARMHDWEILIRQERPGEVTVRLSDAPGHFFRAHPKKALG